MNVLYPHKAESYAIIGAAMKVHSGLGCGFLEAVYQEALAIEFTKRSIPFVEQPELDIYYGGIRLKKKYYPDFICYENIIVEIKAVENLTNTHEAQIINYLRATRLKLGLLINFGEESLNFTVS